MNKNLKIFLAAVFFTFGLLSLAFAEEKLTITTYYPSPYGSYYDLYVASKLGIGTTAPSTLLHVGLAGTTLGTIGVAGNTSGLVTIQPAAAAGTWTLTLPTAVGSAGQQLTDAAGNGITSWAAAGSKREYKNILGTVEPKEALSEILGTPVYRFKYKPGFGTGDYNTEYVGAMADEAPWAMHYDGTIINPVNTLGYMVLGIQALDKKISALGISSINGNVGIGTTSPTLGPLQMGSGAYVTSGGVWTDASSRAYKQDIAPLGLDKAMKTLTGLQPVTFRYKRAPDEQHVGFISEDVPKLVVTKDRTGLSAMDIVAVLTKVVQQQQKEIETLKQEVSRLKRAL